MTLPSLTSLSAVLFASELALAISKRASAKVSAGKDRRSLGILWLVIGLSLWAAFILRAQVPAGQMPFALPCYFTGLALFLLGLIIRWVAIIHLGRFFTVNVAIAADHRLITTGPLSLSASSVVHWVAPDLSRARPLHAQLLRARNHRRSDSAGFPLADSNRGGRVRGDLRRTL